MFLPVQFRPFPPSQAPPRQHPCSPHTRAARDNQRHQKAHWGSEETEKPHRWWHREALPPVSYHSTLVKQKTLMKPDESQMHRAYIPEPLKAWQIYALPFQTLNLEFN